MVGTYTHEYIHAKLTSNDAGRSVGKSPSPLARAGFAPYAISKATISFNLLPAAMWSGVLPRVWYEGGGSTMSLHHIFPGRCQRMEDRWSVTGVSHSKIPSPHTQDSRCLPHWQRSFEYSKHVSYVRFLAWLCLSAWLCTWKCGRVDVASILQEKVDKDEILCLHSIVERCTTTACILWKHIHTCTFTLA